MPSGPEPQCMLVSLGSCLWMEIASHSIGGLTGAAEGMAATVGPVWAWRFEKETIGVSSSAAKHRGRIMGISLSFASGVARA